MKKLYLTPGITTEPLLIEDVMLASEDDGDNVTDNKYDSANRLVNGRAIAHGDSIMDYYK